MFKDAFEITESKDAKTGVIYSSLTMKISSTGIRQELFGEYECTFNILSGKSLHQKLNFSISPIITRTETSATLYEGESYNITCSVVAYPLVNKENIEWRRNNQPIQVRNGKPSIESYDHGGRITFVSKDSPYDTLSFDKLNISDRAVYTCFVETSLGNDTSGIFLRVKSLQSTFWPLIGICVELVILTAVILIYERKRRLVKVKEEPPNDLAVNHPKPASRDSGVRRR
ncbi:hypothetical protein AAHC03_01478 [Spirometra sp. Aus1]